MGATRLLQAVPLWNMSRAIWNIVGVTSACCPGKRGEHWLLSRNSSAPCSLQYTSCTLAEYLSPWKYCSLLPQQEDGTETWLPFSCTSRGKRVFASMALAFERNTLLFLKRHISSVLALLPVEYYSFIFDTILNLQRHSWLFLFFPP